MNRREFIAALGGAAAWPLAARAQQQSKLPTIGFLGSTTRQDMARRTDAFVQRLRELGWLEGRTIAIEYRWAEGSTERAAELATELVRLKVDVIVTIANAYALVAKQATTTIPIVFAGAGDPLNTGLVANLARPGGNITGLSLQQTDTATKRLELLREIVPGLKNLAVLAGTENRAAVLEAAEVQAAARALKLDIALIEIREAKEISPAFDALTGGAQALYVVSGGLVGNNRVRIGTLATAARLPTMHGLREYVEAGGLMSYGPSFTDLFRRAADYVHKILRGAHPGEIPVEQPTKFELVLNLTTAKAIGLKISESFLVRADEVIE